MGSSAEHKAWEDSFLQLGDEFALMTIPRRDEKGNMCVGFVTAGQADNTIFCDFLDCEHPHTRSRAPPCIAGHALTRVVFVACRRGHGANQPTAPNELPHGSAQHEPVYERQEAA